MFLLNNLIVIGKILLNIIFSFAWNSLASGVREGEAEEQEGELTTARADREMPLPPLCYNPPD